jgi:CheY-like chemotaxis protein
MDTLRVLVVDDNKDGADILAGLLELWGHEVKTAYSGPEALKLLADFKPSVVLADIGMAEMDGLEMAESLRQDPAFNDTLLAAITGFTDDQIRREAREAGFDEIFIKPADPEVIREWLEAVACQLQRRSCGRRASKEPGFKTGL